MKLSNLITFIIILVIISSCNTIQTKKKESNCIETIINEFIRDTINGKFQENKLTFTVSKDQIHLYNYTNQEFKQLVNILGKEKIDSLFNFYKYKNYYFILEKSQSLNNDSLFNHFKTNPKKITLRMIDIYNSFSDTPEKNDFAIIDFHSKELRFDLINCNQSRGSVR